jgi:protein-S-isoprenylcysteine O-methyltransferase Ste14
MIYTFLKNILSFILPVTVLVFVPRWVEKNWIIQNTLQWVAGGIVAGFGLTIMFLCISSFIRVGKGTLAPWSPPKKFVVVGLYRYVRNPMILGVIIVLLGEAIIFHSLPILKWAGYFFVINTIYFLIFEEPQLEGRFGQDYLTYKKKVGRWLPRLTPYEPKEKVV